MPVLNFYGMYDHLVPPAASELLTRNVGSKDTEDINLDTGHIGIYVSSKCQREFAPKIARWLMERDEPDAVPKAEAAVRPAAGKRPAAKVRRTRTVRKKAEAEAPKPAPEEIPAEKKVPARGKPSLTQLISETI